MIGEDWPAWDQASAGATDGGEPAVVQDDRAREREAQLDALAAVFSGPKGRAALAALRAMTVEHVLGPEASDAMLRHVEGQRALVLTIEAIVRQRASTGGPHGG